MPTDLWLLGHINSNLYITYTVIEKTFIFYKLSSILMILIRNKHFRVSTVKQNIKDKISKEADHYLGESMTFTLFEFLKDFAEEIVADQPDKEVIESITKLVSISGFLFLVFINNKTHFNLYIICTFQLIDNDDEGAKKIVKKENMSKAQKRKQWDRLDSKGEKPRGYDWIDVVKHLSQTGSSKVEIST